MTLQEVEQSIIEEFSLFDNNDDKYQYLIELANDMQPYPDSAKTEDKKIKGCQSRVWLDFKYVDGKLYFNADSDGVITKGLIALFVRIYSERTPQEILSSDFSILKKIGLEDKFTLSRANGLVSMIAKIKEIAVQNA